MLKSITSFSCRYPQAVFFVVILLTLPALFLIKTKLTFEADMSKFLPKNPTAKKFSKYNRKKKFPYQDALLIGIEKKSGSLLEPDALRNIEKITLDLQKLKTSKTFYSKLTGKKETVNLPLGFEHKSILSVTSMREALYDPQSDAIISGSIIKKLKKDFNISSEKDGEELLPKTNENINKIIPGLKKIIFKNSHLKGSLLSEDLKASAIIVNMIPKQVYKLSRAALELETAIDPERLKNRFQGKDPNFQFQIYGKTIDNIKIDDEYIGRQTSKASRSLQKWLISFCKDALSEDQKLKRILDSPLTAAGFRDILAYAENKHYFLDWRGFSDGLWRNALRSIDPFSRENLEFKFPDVKEIYNLYSIYNLINKLLEKHRSKDINFYPAGQPIVVGSFSYLMSDDIKVMLPIAILVMLLVLLIGYRSARGIFIPLLTVALAATWTLGLMAALDTPLSASTASLPIVLLAIGAAYAIHILNCYYEEVLYVTDRRQLLDNVSGHTLRAVFMAGITTIAGFSSFSFSNLELIRDFGVFSAIGVSLALLLSLTLTPALLIVCPLPRKNIQDKRRRLKQSLFDRIIKQTAGMVIRFPWRVAALSVIIFALSVFFMTKNHFEGSLMSMFKKDSPLSQGDRFFNQKLGGTALVNLTFEFRPRISLENPKVRKKLEANIRDFRQAWKKMIIENEKDNQLDKNAAFEIADALYKESLSLPLSINRIAAQIELIRKTIDEEYFPENDDSKWEQKVETILKLREIKASPSGVKAQYQLNLLGDFLTTNIKQPATLRKIEELGRFLKSMKRPLAKIEGKEYPPGGLVITPADIIKKIYRTFYHNDKSEFYRLPDIRRDAFIDKTLTEGGVAGAILNQALSVGRNDFEKIITSDFKNFQLMITLRSDSSPFIKEYLNIVFDKIKTLFPKDDPYIKSVKMDGYAPVSMAISDLISSSQTKSIIFSFIFVLIAAFFISRSASGGFYVLIPLTFAVILNFGVIYMLDGKITTGSMMVASITIGAGVDYTIHFLERMKLQTAKGDNLSQAYINTVSTAGKAIVLNAVSVAMGFLVLVFSNFVPNIMLGILMATGAIFSAVGALIILPSIIIITRPRFITVVSQNSGHPS